MQVKVSSHLSWQFLPLLFSPSPPVTFWWTLSSLPSCESGGELLYFGEKRKKTRLSDSLVVFFLFISHPLNLPVQAHIPSSVDRGFLNLWSSPLLPSPLYSFHLLSPFTSLLLRHLLISSYFPALPPPIAHLLTQKICLEMRWCKKTHCFCKSRPKQRFLYFIIKSRHLLLVDLGAGRSQSKKRTMATC